MVPARSALTADRIPFARRQAVLLFLAALALYGLSAGVTLWRGSLAPHYVYLAYSFLHGRPYLDPLPPVTYDLLLYGGRWFVAGSPLPAVLMMPFVAIWKLGVSDIPLGILAGALNVALVYGLLGQLGEFLPMTESARRWLTVLMAAGTVHWYAAVVGAYWFNAHVVTVLFVLLHVRQTLGMRPGKEAGAAFLAGAWLSLAGLARPTALFGATFFLAWVWLRRREYRWLPALALFGAALGLGLGAHLAYNVWRFGHPLDFGYAYVQGAENITQAYAAYGGFNLHFIPTNLYNSILRPPDLSARLPFVTPSPWGMSLFLTTPAFVYLLRAARREPVVLASWGGLFSILLPLWMYHNTGSLQFGYRYALDAAPFLIILTAAGMRGEMNRWKRALIVAAILINWAGMAWMFKHLNGLGWVEMWVHLPAHLGR